MRNFSFYGKKLQNLCSGSISNLSSFCKSTCFLVILICRFVVFRVNPLSLQVLYFVSLSSLGFAFLKVLKPRTEFTPRNLDLFFTSVSATTVSSMSTVEMEVFSNAQLVIMTILMFIGGEVFLSMVGLYLSKSKILRPWKNDNRVNSSCESLELPPSDLVHEIELVDISRHTSRTSNHAFSLENRYLKYKSIKFLGFVILGYLLIIHVLGVSLVSLYMSIIPSAKEVLRKKGLNTFIFATFTVVSTFASCGFVPVNENMIAFSKNSGLLWMLIPQVLFGNTLYPSCLRFSIWFLGKFFKKEEANYLLKNTTRVGYFHLLPRPHSMLLVVTVLGFILIQFILFCCLEWNSSALTGLNVYQKIVGVLFQTVNARHTGETIVDLSVIAPAMLVLFVVMMYLPPYTSFLPIKRHEEEILEGCESNNGKMGRIKENFVFSQLSYLVIFIILICITEREMLKQDPLNFNVFNITIELISAYGNVGFTTGYSCDRLIKPDATCMTKWYGFVGKWSDEGKIILIVVMFFGRLKKFNMDGGKAWKLL